MLKNVPPRDRVELGEKLRNLSDDEKRAFMDTLSEQEAIELIYDPFISIRPDQHVVWTDDKPIVLLLAGRSFGKTYTAVRVIKGAVEAGVKEITLAAPTSNDLVNTLLEGPSGLYSAYHENDPDFPIHIVSKSKVRFPVSGAEIRLVSGDAPERSRGINSELLIVDELAAIPDGEEFVSNLLFGLRLGKAQALFITTPKSTPIMIDLYNRRDKDVKLMSGSSMANRANMAENFFKNAEAYRGTARYRREILGEIILENSEALWQRDMLDKIQIPKDEIDPLTFVEVCVGIDPAGRATKDSDLFGIVVAAKDVNDNMYVVEDLSGKHNTAEWSAIVGRLYRKYSDLCLTKLALETNGAGVYVHDILLRDHGRMNTVPIKSTASKFARAEEAAFFYYQDRVKHCADSDLRALEDEMTGWSGGPRERSPNRLDALVFALKTLSPTKRDSLKVKHFAF